MTIFLSTICIFSSRTLYHILLKNWQLFFVLQFNSNFIFTYHRVYSTLASWQKLNYWKYDKQTSIGFRCFYNDHKAFLAYIIYWPQLFFCQLLPTEKRPSNHHSYCVFLSLKCISCIHHFLLVSARISHFRIFHMYVLHVGMFTTHLDTVNIIH